ncbi:hypothetical protein VT84_10200 [Gemmata sp. SH-PL17]|uniref:hypothetical protein n=1 Tax=Gemmata sp. SH-PL17 TaxID=1630693 RepID=UPI00078CBD36|nr:hypothetical protein [Gemmata sp. SH-PL17]AMV24757.1 hypothetical protein VT84_10200 [Gemmata sp. SH-PL17]
MFTAKLSHVHPILLLGVVVLAFTGWIAYEGVTGQGAASVMGSEQSESEDGAKPLPKLPPEVVIGAVCVGQPRLFVEQHLMAHSAGDIDPVDLSAGAPVLRSRYRVYIGRPLPHLNPSLPPHMFRPGSYILTLEFDGRHAGHPLFRIDLSPENPG